MRRTFHKQQINGAPTKTVLTGFSPDKTASKKLSQQQVKNINLLAEFIYLPEETVSP
jgi:hypothetical protein